MKCLTLYLLVSSADILCKQGLVGPYLDPKCLPLMVFLKEFFEKVAFEKISRRQKMQNYPGGKDIIILMVLLDYTMEQRNNQQSLTANLADKPFVLHGQTKCGSPSFSAILSLLANEQLFEVYFMASCQLWAST